MSSAGISYQNVITDARKICLLSVSVLGGNICLLAFSLPFSQDLCFFPDFLAIAVLFYSPPSSKVADPEGLRHTN